MIAQPRTTAGWPQLQLSACLWLLLAALSSLPSATAALSYPYVPSQMLMPSACTNASACHGPDTAYVFTRGEYGVEFLALNFSAAVDADTRLDPATSEVPFLGDGDGGADTATFTAVRTGDGSVLVYAGECDGGRGDVWTYSGDSGDDWVKRTTKDEGSISRGPYFLGDTLAFSSTIAPELEEPTIYTYGGMCASPQTDTDDWQSAGNYTKTMMRIAPTDENSNDSDNEDTGYSVSVASNGGPRTAMAGFTLTPLPPSITNISGLVTQQASYVLLGGHTQQAFINMSTAAVWNLPEESWTYVSIQPPDSRGSIELARAADNVYSRSGHTAVLSSDGDSVVVLGGWVGDIDTPAEPQLAVLEMSGAYSGWRWTVPDEQPGEGVYGHAAAVLPGNVMVVYGGWEMGAAKEKRQATSGATRFLNLTSMEWTTSYTNPSALDGSSGDGSNDAPGKGGDSSKSIRLGLGLGLGLGIGLLLLLILGFFCWRRKQRSNRERREEAVRSLSQDASHFLHDNDEMLERDDLFLGSGGWYTGGHDAYQTGERSLGYESLRGSRGSTYNIPPPPGAQRKPVARQLRGGYVPAGPRPSTFMSTPGQIHPILEDDEEDYPFHHNPQEVHTPTSEAPSDPFLTPTTAAAPPVFMPPSRASSTPSPEGTRRHDPEVQDWVSDVDAADAMLARMNSRHGRMSPTRRGSHRSANLRDDDSRSGSNLSESNRSAADSLRLSPVSRKANTSTSGGMYFGSSTLLGGSEHQKPGSSSSSSYNTAKSTFGALQAEGPSLLLGRSTPNPYDDDERPGSPSKSKPLRRGWLGSLRRVFSSSGTTTPTSSRDESPRRMSLDRVSADYEPRMVGLSGELLRRKQGRHDWEHEAMMTPAAAAAAHVGENDWDIERAVEQRLVQVVFTVPKERLRVVNADSELPEEEAQMAELVDPEKASSRDDESARSLVRPVTPERRPERDPERDVEKDGLLRVDQDEDEERRMSHTSDGYGSDRRPSSVAVLTAETVTMRRPKSRVLQMVDSIEKDSREGSPVRSGSASPVR